MKAGDEIQIVGHKGRQLVTVVGFHVGTDDMVIDDRTGDADAMRFCDPGEVVSNKTMTPGADL